MPSTSIAYTVNISLYARNFENALSNLHHTISPDDMEVVHEALSNMFHMIRHDNFDIDTMIEILDKY